MDENEEKKINEQNNFQKLILRYIRIERDKQHRRDSYYLKELNRIHEARKNKKLVFTFNWAAAFFSISWCWYRKMYLASFLMLILSAFSGLLFGIITVVIGMGFNAIHSSIFMFLSMFVQGISGNYFYYYFIKRKLKIGDSAVNNMFGVILLPILIGIFCGIIEALMLWKIL